ncbi:sigma-70 family RNA polymerase sigma factor [Actinomadura xylanilytica]|uniref:sigma-70 family RNA polymerase sigma factor n=1 Tax=Actinomadura xylanilytica TaxID=887459 RepID=UPI00255B3E7D|nr:sigma-70 family RNA polymerase sigma factor [Actinomadura xylanilytica]MDL4773998.1 sigma-70 family RNA polymerase sigma factor [Actinomadura xylanilytica]
MTDHVLVEALRERDPDAPASVYDAYAERLYAYCWFRLRGQGAAQAALRDTFTVAEAHIAKLRDPDRFGPWLYAIARQECEGRQPCGEQPPDLPAAGDHQEDVDQRIVASRAVLALSPLAREILELRIRHQLSVPDLAAVFDLPAKDAQAALDRGHDELETALTAEILAHQGPHGCVERALLLQERHGELSRELSGRLTRHALDCIVCKAFRPRAVSAAKVYGMLPKAETPEGLRRRVISSFQDTEPVGERLSAADRITEFTPDGFPRPPQRQTVSPEPALPLQRARFPWSRRLGTSAAAGALLLSLGGGVSVLYGVSGASDQNVGPAASEGEERPVSGAEWPEVRSLGRPGAGGAGGTLTASATFPLGARTPSAPSTSFAPPPDPRSFPPAPSTGASSGAGHSTSAGTLVVSASALDLAGGANGSIELQAAGGPVTWLARASGPVRLSRSSGRLEAGQSMTLGVHVVRKARSSGEGRIDFAPGGPRVRVTWRPADNGPGHAPVPVSPPGTVPGTTPGTTAPGSAPPPSPSESGRPGGQSPSSDTPPPSNDSPPPAGQPEPVP